MIYCVQDALSQPESRCPHALPLPLSRSAATGSTSPDVKSDDDTLMMMTLSHESLLRLVRRIFGVTRHRGTPCLRVKLPAAGDDLVELLA
jgi:hypothetical protein